MPEYGSTYYGAFYSSAMDGIVTDPSLMSLPVDDQFVCKGYGTSETVLLREGHIYMLDEHIAHLKESCEQLGMDLPKSEAALKRIILDTAAASGNMNGQLRFWATLGRGGFSAVQIGASEPGFYVLCLSDTYDLDRVEAWDAVVVQQPISPTMVSNVPGNQQLLTSLAQAIAAEGGAQVAIFVDAEGFVQHAAGHTLCVLTNTDELVYPPNDNVSPSVTLKRMLDMIPDERARSPDDVIVATINQRPLHVSEVAAAKEAFLVCTTYTIAPIKSVDGNAIADGKTGLTTLALHYMLDNDQIPPAPGAPRPRHASVPYGYMSGMRAQLV